MAEAPQFESVVTDAMRAQIGVPREPFACEVTTTGVRMFARAVGYTDPIYYDRAEAQRRGLRDLPAPPGYLGTPIFDPAASDPTGGTRRGTQAGVRSPYTLVLNGGTDVEYTGVDICAGDELTGVARLESLTERYSPALAGPMLVQVTATTYTNQQGEVVATVRGTGLSYGPRRGDG